MRSPYEDGCSCILDFSWEPGVESPLGARIFWFSMCRPSCELLEGYWSKRLTLFEAFSLQYFEIKLDILKKNIKATCSEGAGPVDAP